MQTFLQRKHFLPKPAILQLGKVRFRVVTCFAKGYTGYDTGVRVPISGANVLSRAVTTDWFGKPLMEAMNSHASTLFARPNIIDKLLAVWLPKFVFPFPVPLLCWKAGLSRICTRPFRNVDNLRLDLGFLLEMWNPERRRVCVLGEK